MNLFSWIVLGIIAFAVVLAVRYMRRHKGSCSSCGGDCAHCSGCSTCKGYKNDKK